jgi:hypothetical protein
MKRSERLKQTARAMGLLALLMLAAGAGGMIWAVVAAQAGYAPGGAGLMLAAATALAMAVRNAREWVRLRRMCREEAHWEGLRAVRPRL